MGGGLLSLKWNNHRSSFIHVLSSLRKKDMYADVTIACEGKFYPTHKLVLSTCSEYFQEMFQQTQCKHPVIVLKDIHWEELEALLNYMYLGEVNVVQEKLSSLIKSAECLKIKGLAVPDDPPPKGGFNEKRNLNHGCSSESKRRKGETEYLSKENKCLTTRNSFPVSNLSTDTNDNLKEYEENIKDTTKDSPPSRIKEEPIDIIEVEDSKEGILSNSHLLRSIPMHGRSLENISESNESWIPENSENCNTNEYSINEESVSSNIEASSLNAEIRDPFENELWPPNCNYDGVMMNHDSDTFLDLRKPYCCPFCEKPFDHKGNYKKHIQTHTGERPFICEICNCRFVQKAHLLKHMSRIHPLNPNI